MYTYNRMYIRVLYEETKGSYKGRKGSLERDRKGRAVLQAFLMPRSRRVSPPQTVFMCYALFMLFIVFTCCCCCCCCYHCLLFCCMHCLFC